MTTVNKKKHSFKLTDHSIERVEERFSHLTEEQLQDSFNRSKTLDNSNSQKYGQSYVKRVFSKLITHPDYRMCVNPHYDIVWVINQKTKQVTTVYSFTEGNDTNF